MFVERQVQPQQFLLLFHNSTGTQIGTITASESATAYNISSDYRLKENIVDINDGITRLKQLQLRRFNFKIDPSTTVDGFVAHEVTVVPEAITGEKDGMVDIGTLKDKEEILLGLNKKNLMIFILLGILLKKQDKLKSIKL